MNAIEIRNLSKRYGSRYAVRELNMNVPLGAIYGFIGENGSGKSTTEKLICGLIHSNAGSIRLFGEPNTQDQIRKHIGVLIEDPGCFPNMTVWENMKLQAENLGIKNTDMEIRKVLRTVRMEGAASNKFRNCSLGMKQRIGIAFALLGNPRLLILDEPINGLDADGMRIMRETLTDLSRHGVTILISSHILGELEKIATHYGIIRHGRLIAEMTAEELDRGCRTYTALKTSDMAYTKQLLLDEQKQIGKDARGYIRVYDKISPEKLITFLYKNKILVREAFTEKISLEEFYTDLVNDPSPEGNGLVTTKS